ncbi:PLD nuclease N-terminal domain-containing protein [Salinibacterium sp.]|uniref:PLD nuclease N-terminal domain-containing protein n=1 Tax=Salinibacterium sp. TaxID=1915057 RepID=UPI00286AEEE4|nr:PLD nuclease N-terminal domain-containing protein [Salinibacterium sp.]
MDTTNIVHVVILVVVFAAWIALWITAVASIFRNRATTSFERGIWTAVVIVLPFLGPLIWFAWGRTRARVPAKQA